MNSSIKSAGKKKGSDALDLHNEVKIITSSDKTYALWSEFISSYAQGELIDVDSSDLRKMKDKPSWKAAREGVLNREFFKWLGNLSEADHEKMLLHILNRSGTKRTQRWPKVVIKQPASVLESCYTVKEWVERRKRKQLVRRELTKIKPELAFYDATGNLILDRWKQFKREYFVSSATMRILLEQPGENFFKEGKMLRSKNKKTEELSPYAKAFFKQFLEKRSSFQKPIGSSFFRKYNAATGTLGRWPANSWGSNSPVRLGVIDFRFVPGYSRRATSGVLNPFFSDFMNTLKSGGMPGLTQPEVWIWICGDHEAEIQAYAEIANAPWVEHYDRFASAYIQGRYERLGDVPTNSKTVKDPVRMIWLTQKNGIETVGVRDEFRSPNHPANEKSRKYQELDLRVNNGEFTMEFYFQVLGMLCKPGDVVFSAFGGSKLLIAAVVSVSYRHIVDIVKWIPDKLQNQLESS